MKTHFYVILFLFNLGLYAQSPPPNFTNCGTPTQGNLVINGGFEEFTNYPTNTNGQLIFTCRWIDNANGGTPDYFHRDSGSTNIVTVPINAFGDQDVNPEFGGDAYAGFGVSTGLTEIIATQLSTPLQPNRNYILSFDISMADGPQNNSNYTPNPIKIQAFLSNSFISEQENIELSIGNNPNNILVENDALSNNTEGWDRIDLPISSGNGGQQYLYIGGISDIYFQNPNLTDGAPTYYYIDNVSLVQGNIECMDESIEITCYNSENSNTSTVCGNFTTAYPEDYQLTITGYTGIFQNQFTLNHEDFTIPEEDIQINTDGTITGTYCIEFTNQGNLDYNVSVTLSSNSDICSRSTPFTSLFNLDLCTQEPDPCEDASIEIVSNIPNCADLNAFGSFPIMASINLPAGYTSENAIADIGANNFTLHIIDVNNPDPPFITLNSSDIIDGDFGTNVMQLTFLVSNAIITSMSETTSYEFQFNANLNGECDLSDTEGTFSLIGCTETSVDLYPINEDCNELGDSFTLCGSFSTSLNDNAVLHENGLVLEAIHASGTQIVNASLFIPFGSNEFCFTIPVANLPYGLVGSYDFRVTATFSDDNSQGFTETDTENGIDFNPCDSSDPCDIVSINITSEIPNCNIFENSSTFDICGTFTTDANSNYNLFLNVLSNCFPPQNTINITPNTTTVSNGIRSGTFCITLNESNFNPNCTYQINTQISTQINGVRCTKNTDNIPLPIEDCSSDCEEITSEINGDNYCWTDVADSYEVEIISDNSCHDTNETIEEWNFETTNSCLNLFDISDKTGRKCFRIRIRASGCDDWNECLVGVSNDGPYFVYFGPCQTTAKRIKSLIMKGSIKLHPNPAKDEFVVSSNDDKLSAIEVYNIYGRLVKNYKNINDQKLLITASDLPKGYYFVHILTENGNKINKKILIE